MEEYMKSGGRAPLIFNLGQPHDPVDLPPVKKALATTY